LKRLRQHLPIRLDGAPINLLRGDRQQPGPLDTDRSGAGAVPQLARNVEVANDARTEYAHFQILDSPASAATGSWGRDHGNFRGSQTASQILKEVHSTT